MFEKVLVEKEIAQHPQTLKILSRLKQYPVQLIDRYDQFWGQVKKPYLHKRESLNLFIAQKRGELVKKAPEAYGTQGAQHYYYVHSYNCIYECQYCYLQGYFKTPDLVFFVNHHEIIEQMQKIADEQSDVWFHAGEFSDSLALAHFSQELQLYFDFFAKNPHCKLELRTKSANISSLLALNALENVYVTYSLSPSAIAKAIDLKTPAVSGRMAAMSQLASQGYRLAVHFDPVVYHPDFAKLYQELLDQLFSQVPAESIAYYSLGVVRFTKDVYQEVVRNYPESTLHSQEMIKSFDGKVRYPKPMRSWMLGTVKDQLMKRKIEKEKIYFCMEENQ